MNIAAWCGSLKCLQELVQHKPTLASHQWLREAAGGNPEHETEQIHIIAFVLELGADIDDRDSRRWSALHYAVKEGKSAMTRFLLHYGASPNLVTKTDYLVYNEQSIRYKHERGGTPLDIAKELNHSAIVDILEQDLAFRVTAKTHGKPVTRS